jgi:hypothetical protein
VAALALAAMAIVLRLAAAPGRGREHGKPSSATP